MSKYSQNYPEQWQMKLLTDIIHLNPNYSSPEQEDYAFIPMDALNTETMEISYYKRRNQDKLTNVKIKNDDVLFARITPSTENGKGALIHNLQEPIAYGSTELVVLSPIKEYILPKFLFYTTKLPRFRNRAVSLMEGATGRQRVPKKFFESQKILLPPIIEQEKIASFISNVDEIIIYLQKIINQLQVLKKGLMQRLFTEGIGHTEFKDTRLGKIPKEWEIVPISRIGKVIGGGTPDTKNETYWNGHISWATPTDVTHLQGKYISQTNRNISNEGLSNSSAKILPTFSLLMTSRASIGYCAINTREMSTNQGFQSIIPNKNIDIEFLYYIIQSFKVQKQLVRFAYGSTFTEIPNKDAKKIKILLPKLNEQQKIVSLLSKLDNIIIEENQTKSILIEIKKGLMQDLLTGRKRVKINLIM